MNSDYGWLADATTILTLVIPFILFALYWEAQNHDGKD